MNRGSAGTFCPSAGAIRNILDTLQSLCDRGVHVRLLHATRPSQMFRAELSARSDGGFALPISDARMPAEYTSRSSRRRCTPLPWQRQFHGSGARAKGDGRRNFEMGIFTDDEWMLDLSKSVSISSGEAGVRVCRLRRECPLPLDGYTGRALWQHRLQRSVAARPHFLILSHTVREGESGLGWLDRVVNAATASRRC